MRTLTDEQLVKYNALRAEAVKYCLDLVDGEVDEDNPKPITLHNASCIAAKIHRLLIEIDLVIDGNQ